MKKLLLSFLVLFGVCGVMNAQTPYKVLEVYKDGKVTHTHKLSDIDSMAVRTVGETPDTPVVPDNLNGHEYVDLGLPSGTLWATTNVGAYSPADYGDYFAWGETRPKASYDWSTYKWCNGLGYTFTKYNIESSCGTVDGKTVLEISGDVAAVRWGRAWRMPTNEEQQELMNTDYCTWIWTTKTNRDGESVNGYEVKSKSNGNFIFLPAAGFRYASLLADTGDKGLYWSSSLYLDDTGGAYRLNFDSVNYRNYTYAYRYAGLSVRPVLASVRD